MNKTRAVVLALSFMVLSAVSAAPPELLPPIPNARTPIADVLCGGQPTAEEIAAAGAAGYKTVINLRADSESGFAWEPAAVEAAGMTYVSIPVPGSKDFTMDNVTRLDAALKAAEAKGPVLLHCTSGNRVGAMLALRAAWLDGKDPAAALALGEAAGLTHSKSTVKNLLEAPESAATPK